MHILICPHCTTSYAIEPATLGAAGRTVRCSRCQEVWLARPEDVVETVAPAVAMAEADLPPDAAAGWGSPAREDAGEEPPHVESPSIAGDFPADHQFSSHIDEDDGQTTAFDETPDTDDGGRKPWFRKLFARSAPESRPRRSLIKPSTACAAMGALVAALLIWRAELVRLLPQTAAFYKLAGLEVNLRGVQFKDVKVTTETVEGKPVLVIEGLIVGESRQPVDLPRLRFSVRDAQGAEIYAWNTVLQQSVLKPGESASFRSRLASPPAEGRSIDIRFFNKRDIAGGSV